MRTALSIWLSWLHSEKQRELVGVVGVVQSHTYSHCCNNLQPNKVLSEVLLVLRPSKINENFHLVSLHQPSPASPPPSILIKSFLATFPPHKKKKKKGKLDLWE